MKIVPVGIRKTAVTSFPRSEGTVKFSDCTTAWGSFKRGMESLGVRDLPDKYPGGIVEIVSKRDGGIVTYQEQEEEYDLREPKVRLTRGLHGTKEVSLNDGQRLFSTYCKVNLLKEPNVHNGCMEVPGLHYEEIPAPVVKVGVCFIDGDLIGCREVEKARDNTNRTVISLIGGESDFIDFEKEKQPVNIKKKLLFGLTLHYYETTTDKLEEIPMVASLFPEINPNGGNPVAFVKPEANIYPGSDNWTWKGQSGVEKYGKTRADFPTPYGFIRAERNPVAGTECYELLKGKFVELIPPQGHRYDVTIKIDGAFTEGVKGLTRQQIAEQYLPCGGLEALLMEFKEAEDGSRFSAKIRPENQKAFRLEAVRI